MISQLPDEPSEPKLMSSTLAALVAVASCGACAVLIAMVLGNLIVDRRFDKLVEAVALLPILLIHEVYAAVLKHNPMKILQRGWRNIFLLHGNQPWYLAVLYYVAAVNVLQAPSAVIFIVFNLSTASNPSIVKGNIATLTAAGLGALLNYLPLFAGGFLLGYRASAKRVWSVVLFVLVYICVDRALTLVTLTPGQLQATYRVAAGSPLSVDVILIGGFVVISVVTLLGYGCGQLVAVGRRMSDLPQWRILSADAKWVWDGYAWQPFPTSFSPDGFYFWDGHVWRRTPRWLSPDYFFEWDGHSWRPVTPASPAVESE